MSAPVPTRLHLHRTARELEVCFADGHAWRLPCEYLRVFSPSAEVRGHGGGEPILVPGKRGVNISRIEPVGRYAVRLVFDDGHDTGLYAWDLFEDLGANRERYWARYEARLAAHGMSRDSDVTKLSALPPRKYTPKPPG